MIGYDDAESIAIKVNYTIQRGLGGIMVWVCIDKIIHFYEKVNFGYMVKIEY